MKTSYFSKYKESNGVSIAIGTPKWFKGETFPELFPSWDLVNYYKRTGDEVGYRERYYEEVLYKLNPTEVYDKLKDKVILCWETSDKFCHRHIVSEWIYEELGIIVNEVC